MTSPRSPIATAGPFLYDMVEKRFLQITQGLTLGRASDDFHLKEDHRLSREHIRFELKDGHVFFTDLGSTNGTKLNGHAVSRHLPIPINDSDLLELGKQRFYFTMKQEIPDDSKFTALLEGKKKT